MQELMDLMVDLGCRLVQVMDRIEEVEELIKEIGLLRL